MSFLMIEPPESKVSYLVPNKVEVQEIDFENGMVEYVLNIDTDGLNEVANKLEKDVDSYQLEGDYVIGKMPLSEAKFYDESSGQLVRVKADKIAISDYEISIANISFSKHHKDGLAKVVVRDEINNMHYFEYQDSDKFKVWYKDDNIIFKPGIDEVLGDEMKLKALMQVSNMVKQAHLDDFASLGEGGRTLTDNRRKSSRMDYFKDEIEELIGKGVSIRSAWKIVNDKLPSHAKISYSGFYHYVKQHIKSDKEINNNGIKN